MLSFIKKKLLLGALSIISVIPAKANVVPLTDSEIASVRSCSVKEEFKNVDNLMSVVRSDICFHNYQKEAFDNAYQKMLELGRNPEFLKRSCILKFLFPNLCDSSDIPKMAKVLTILYTIMPFTNNPVLVVTTLKNISDYFIEVNNLGDRTMNTYIKIFNPENKLEFISFFFKAEQLTFEELKGNSETAKVYCELLRKLEY